jgi:hypothetical protein
LISEEVDHVAENLEKQTEVRALFTPWKRRRLDRAVAPSPSESLASFQDVTFVSPLDDLGGEDAPSMVISNLTMAWPGLIRNVSTIHEMAASVKKGNKELAGIFEDEMQAAGGQLLMVLSKLGERPSKLNGASAFEAIGSLDEEVVGVSKELNILGELMKRIVEQVSATTVDLQDIRVELAGGKGRGVLTEELNQAKGNILAQVRGAIDPFIQLVGRLSSSKDDPGGLFVKRVIALEREVVELRASKADANGPAGLSAPPISTRAAQGVGVLNWSLATPAAAGAPAGGRTGPSTKSEWEIRTQQTITTLKRRIGDLENQFGGEAVVVSGAEFKSSLEAGAWLTPCPRGRRLHVLLGCARSDDRSIWAWVDDGRSIENGRI